MLHTKFQGNMASGSGEEDFFKVLSTVAILVMWPESFI